MSNTGLQWAHRPPWVIQHCLLPPGYKCFDDANQKPGHRGYLVRTDLWSWHLGMQEMQGTKVYSSLSSHTAIIYKGMQPSEGAPWPYRQEPCAHAPVHPTERGSAHPFLIGEPWTLVLICTWVPMKASQHSLTASLHTKLLPTQNMMQEVLHVEGAEVHQTLWGFFS